MSNTAISQDLVNRRCHLPDDHIGLDPFSLEHEDDEGTIVGIRYGQWAGQDTESMIASVRWDKNGRVIDVPVSMLWVAPSRADTKGKEKRSYAEKYPVDRSYVRERPAKNPIISFLRRRSNIEDPAPIKATRGRPKGSTKKKTKVGARGRK